MEFHNPDPRWEAFECPTYESYLKHYLVRGSFHKKVPKEIVDSFITIEYLMAHAYYHYPMYDEALSKLLRTTEMAVKLRCKELNIPTTKQVIHRRTKESKEEGRTFYELINDLDKAEPEKDLKNSLHQVRSIRNNSMHPEYNSYMGGIGMGRIISGVSILNAVFAKASFFTEIKLKLIDYRAKIQPFKNQAMVLDFDNKRILVHELNIIDLFYSETDEVACIFIQPVILITDEIIKERQVTGATPLTYHVRNLQISENSILCTEIATNQPIKITFSSNIQDKEQCDRYKKYITEPTMGIYNPYHFTLQSNFSTAVLKFRYNYYNLLPTE